MGLLTIKTIEAADISLLAISLSEAKAYCGVGQSDNSQNSRITGSIRSAMSYIEGKPALPICFFTKKWQADFEIKGFKIVLPKSPIQSIQSVEQMDSIGNYTSISDYIEIIGDDYSFIYLPISTGHFEQKNIRITFTAGWETQAEIPEDLKTIIGRLVGDNYDLKNDVFDAQMYQNTAGVELMLQNYKRLI